MNVWVTMTSCSECLRNHDADSWAGVDCDCWCHDGDTGEDDADA